MHCRKTNQNKPHTKKRTRLTLDHSSWSLECSIRSQERCIPQSQLLEHALTTGAPQCWADDLIGAVLIHGPVAIQMCFTSNHQVGLHPQTASEATQASVAGQIYTSHSIDPAAHHRRSTIAISSGGFVIGESCDEG